MLPYLRLPPTDRKRTQDGDFTKDLLNASNSVLKHLAYVSQISPTQPKAELETAIIVGHMVRIYKLYDTIIALSRAGRAEMAAILTRPLVECIINFAYFLDHGNNDLFEQFRRSSYAYEEVAALFWTKNRPALSG